MGDEYTVEMDYEGFRRVFTAISGPYMRKVGVFGLVCVSFWDFVAVGMLLNEHDRAVNGVGKLLLLLVFVVAITVLFAWAVISPTFVLGTRAGLVRGWFAMHGCPDAGLAPLKGLSCSYQVQLGDHGYTMRAPGADAIRIPWLMFSDKAIRLDDEVILCTRDGEEVSSLMRNFWGIDWMMRKELPAEVLVIPEAVERAHPGLPRMIRDAVRSQTDQFARAKQTHDRTWIESLGEWVQGR